LANLREGYFVRDGYSLSNQPLARNAEFDHLPGLKVQVEIDGAGLIIGRGLHAFTRWRKDVAASGKILVDGAPGLSDRVAAL
jgi:hypothetical protein